MRLLSIRSKFILAFLTAALASIALVGVFTMVISKQKFESLVIESRSEEIQAYILNYYQDRGGLAGIEITLRPPPSQVTPGTEPLFPPGFILADAHGRIILGDSSHPIGSQLRPSDYTMAEAIQSEGTTIAHLAVINPTARPNPREQEFFRQTNSALLYASLGAVVLSVLLGLIFTQSLLKPLDKLSLAIKNMEKGELQQEIKATSQDELGQVIQTFNQMSQTISQAKLRRQQMTADIAHELRSPLTVINGYLEALLDGTLTATPERIKTIQHEVDQLNRLVSDLRTLALADAGQLSITNTAIKSDQIFQRLKKAFELAANEKGIKININNQSSNILFWGDEGRMIQALGNLVSNAIRHTEPDGRISLSASTAPEGIRLIVKDTGTGIPEEHLANLFERFYRADTSRYATEGETGLGLSITKAIVEAHRGQISVHSEVGEGTIFIITLPDTVEESG